MARREPDLPAPADDLRRVGPRAGETPALPALRRVAGPGLGEGRRVAHLVAEYPSENRAELLAEHEQSAHELAEFQRSLSGEQRRGGTGMLLVGDELTIRQNVDWFIQDHHHHSEQIRDLAKGT